MFKTILLALAVLIAAFCAYVAFQPSAYHVVRETRIAAPPDAVFALVNDFHNWDAWSPWAKLDPAMKTTYSGASAGTGAVYEWTGDSKVGAGRMTILESKPYEKVRINLEFLKPFASVSDTEFTIKPDGTGAAVTWSMAGDNNFIAKAFMTFTGGMDKAIGPDFDRGLAQMKAAAESKK